MQSAQDRPVQDNSLLKGLTHEKVVGTQSRDHIVSVHIHSVHVRGPG
jgi:hypothetical protein